MTPARTTISRRGLLFLLGLSAGCWLAGGAGVALKGESPLPENPVAGASSYIQYWPGELPVVISAPHGGRAMPKEIPNRPYGKLLRDTATLELAVEIRAAMLKQYGKAPHLIVCQLARVKLDCNREVREAAQGNAKAVEAWEEYHGYIREAAKAVRTRYGKGLYLDIHGHSHEKARIELGYLLGSKDLQLSDQRLNTAELIAKSSISHLAGRTKLEFPALVRGSTSLGGLLEQRGFASVPSPSSQLLPGDLYFNGGYSTETHGSRGVSGLDGIQVETPGLYRDSPEKRVALARAMSDALHPYLQMHMGLDLHADATATPAGDKPAK